MLGSLHHHRYYLRKKFVHNCSLPNTENVQIEDYYPNTCFLVKQILKLCLIANDVSRRQIYSKSNKALEKERIMHLTEYPFIIHPFSDLSYYIQVLMIVVFIIQIYTTPLIIIARPEWPHGIYFILNMQIFNCLNLITNCFTGRYRPDIKQVVLERKSVLLDYLKSGNLIIDTLGAIPLPFIAFKLGFSILTERILCCLISINLCPLIRYLEIIRLKRGYSFIIFRIFATFIVYLFGVVWLSVLIFVGVHLDCIDKTIKHDVKLWWWVYKTYTFMYGTQIADFCIVGFEFLFSTFAIIFGILIRNVILVQLVILFKTWYSSSEKRTCLFKELNEFCYYKRLPYNLKRRLIQYYKFKLPNVYYNESEIKTQLSENLRFNIKDYLCRTWFHADIFKLCPLALRQLITIHLDEEIYFQNDVIYRAGDPYENIYFIKSGSVLRLPLVTHEIFEVAEGNFFSEKALIQHYNRPHASTMIALEPCQIFKLSRDNFFNIIQNFQPAYAIILDILKNRANYLNTGYKLKSRLNLADYYHTVRRSTEMEDN